MTSNQIAYHNAQELKRHNIATEQETNRHQVVQEALNRWSNALTNWQIAVNNAHYVRMDNETERANKAREAQNAASLSETYRSNISNEDIKRASNALQAAQISETSRHNKSMESIQDRLNASVIELNEAKSVESGAATGLTEARTRTEGYIPTKIVNEIDLTHASAEKARMERQYTDVKKDMEPTNTAINLIGVLGRILF